MNVRWRMLLLGAALLVVGGAGASMASAQASEPAAVITAYEMARNRGDVEAALAYFAEDAALSTRLGTFTGRDEIRRYLQAATGRPRSVVVIDRRTSGSRVAWLERSANPDVNAFETSVEAVVRDGRIRALTYNFGANGSRVEAAVGDGSALPALVGLGSVVMVLCGVVLVISFGLPGRAASSSRLRGRLLRDLRGWQAARGSSG